MVLTAIYSFLSIVWVILKVYKGGVTTVICPDNKKQGQHTKQKHRR